MNGMMIGPNLQDAMCGGRHEGQMGGYSETINSKDLISFAYNGPKKRYSAMPTEEGKLRICCAGGGEYYSRDGSLYNIKYDTDDKSILEVMVIMFMLMDFLEVLEIYLTASTLQEKRYISLLISFLP